LLRGISRVYNAVAFVESGTTDGEMSVKLAYLNTKGWEDDLWMSLRTTRSWRENWMHRIYGVQLSAVSDFAVGRFDLPDIEPKD
jgi:hypothetical protein